MFIHFLLLFGSICGGLLTLFFIILPNLAPKTSGYKPMSEYDYKESELWDAPSYWTNWPETCPELYL